MSPARKKQPDRIKLLDVACGIRKADGATGIDRSVDSDADIIHDLNVFPWPIADESVEGAFISHYVEHIPHYRPEWDHDGWWMFWQEMYRILVHDAEVEIIHPYSRNDRAFYDPTHTRYIHEMTWYYLDPGFREVNMLSHHCPNVDFEVVVVTGQNMAEELLSRNADYQAWAHKFQFNTIADLSVKLRKR